VRYEKRYLDPVLTAMEHEADSLRAIADSVNAAAEKACREKQKRESKEKPVLRFDWSGIVKPDSPEAFKPPFHFPPRRQYRTGTCWSFSSTSFFESEVQRLTGREIKLSEMYTVYWEYVEKARGYIATRGCQAFPTGSEFDAVPLIWKQYGIVPASAYAGLPPDRDKYDDSEMTAEMTRYLAFAKDHGYWDEATVIGGIRAILDRVMGRPPEQFDYEGKRYTPQRFLEKVLKLKLDDYLQVISTASFPFYTRGKFDVGDNWRPTEDSYNVPLAEFYECLTRATAQGYTVAIGGDTSEAGLYGLECAAVVPSFDIAQDGIDQDSREFRIDNRTTGDDHGIHLLASLQVGGRDWFLIKDSGSSAQWGPYKGYYFFRDDYIKLKMLSFMVHKDVVQFLMPKFTAHAESEAP
jgi:bleomycin hydrolase